MRVATWNLWWRYGPWRERREPIAATLAGIDADLYGLQEVWGADGQNFAAELAQRLGLHWCWTVAARGADGLSIGNAVLSRWPIATTAETALPTGDPHEGRAAVCARVETPGGPLTMVTTHLTYGPGLSAVRLAQVERLGQFVAEHSQDAAYPPVITGDLNAEPDSDELRRLGGLVTAPSVPGLVLVDAWRYAAPDDPGFTWDRRNAYQSDNPLPNCRIDYVLVGLPRAGRGRVLSARLAGAEPVDGIWPSDHFAVVADIED
jgi:endonuclease/exonuclease/phosphatase family metal-dependent hydrolase